VIGPLLHSPYHETGSTLRFIFTQYPPARDQQVWKNLKDLPRRGMRT